MGTKAGYQTRIEEVLRSKIINTQGLTITQLAEILNISRTTVYEIFSGKRKISRSLAFRLEEKFGESAAFWMNLGIPLRKGLGDGSLEDRLVSYGPGPLSALEIIDFCKSGEITIEPFEINCVKPVSYDLRAKKVLVENENSGEAIDIDLDNEDLDLLPGNIAFAISKEKIGMPLLGYGRLGQIGELIHDGIVVEHGIGIDPGFKGRIACLIINTGKQKYTLKKDSCFLSVELNVLPVPPTHPYNGYGQGRKGFGDREKETICSKIPGKQIDGSENIGISTQPDMIESFINDLASGVGELIEKLKTSYKL